MKRDEFGDEAEDLSSKKPEQSRAPSVEIMAEHTMKPDESLSHLALKYYGSAVREMWMIIYEANKDVIGPDPAHVRPGTVLKIPKLSKG
ncbi:MAG: LysM peptidoglycan-binding domain-containing protein [Chloroflexi bacterium]|nr:MAG: LysM peptidoglycan-binding domain-containing protein [Chloroflexota bacterium]